MKKLAIVFSIVLVMGCSTTTKAAFQDIHEGLDNATNEYPHYSWERIPVNEKALAIEATKGYTWEVPEEYRKD